MKSTLSFTLILSFLFLPALKSQETRKTLANREAYASRETRESYIYAREGKLYHPNGKEVALWGVNLQPCLSWEYGLLRRAGIEKDTASLHRVTRESLDELELLGCRLIRCHLTPADFTDEEGQLVETVFLDALDYLMAETARRDMYLYLTFLNHMGQGDVPVSFMHGQRGDRPKWIFDRDFADRSKTYITGLLNRENPYSGISYRADTAVAVWEIINEPAYLQYKDLKGSGHEKTYRRWLKKKRLSDGESAFRSYRKMVVLEYINDMYRLIRKTGAKQPVSWCCNWHLMIRDHEDVFAAIGESAVEAVSFCNYPGQSECKHPYYDNPVDLSRHDFSEWYSDCYEDPEYYGWIHSPGFREKAKLVYEFESFYNQSAYLYPVMADFFRSMGVQMAAMWHYSMPAYARFRQGSHVLNLKCTPAKAASFAVAGKIFENTPLLLPYHTESTTEWNSDAFAYSYKHNYSFYSDSASYYFSTPLTGHAEPEPMTGIRQISGCGSSPLVKYTGNGAYRVLIRENELDIRIQPDVRHLKELWNHKDPRKIPATLFIDKEHRSFQLMLKGWERGSYTLYEELDGKLIRKGTMNSTGLFVKPGHYKIVRNLLKD